MSGFSQWMLVVFIIAMTTVFLHNYSIAEDYSIVPKSYYQETTYTKDEAIQIIAEESRENYNRGYRAGRMDMIAEIVECDGVSGPEVMSKYLLLGELMNELGELDHSVYPCEE